MIAGDAPPCSFEVDIAGRPFPLKEVTKMQVLGTVVESEFDNTHGDIRHRIMMARRTFFAQSPYFRSKSVSPRAKFYRNQQRVQSVMSYGLDC
eukprot:1030183-Pyramimonas_sp.AAC.1